MFLIRSLVGADEEAYRCNHPALWCGCFLVLSELPQYAPLILSLLIGGALLGLLAALAGLFGAPPRWTPTLLWGWVLFVSLFGILLAVGCLFIVLYAGDHISKPNSTQSKAIITALGAAVGVTATAVYSMLPKMGYSRFARVAVTFRYETAFPNITTRNDIGFKAGRAAVQDEGGAVDFPANWQVTRSEQSEGSPLRTVVIDGWKFKAVRVRLDLIRQGLAGQPSPPRPLGESGDPPQASMVDTDPAKSAEIQKGTPPR
jgi:hypothetical protein